MRTAAERAIQLDPLLGEAHGAMGIVYAREAQWAQSEKSFRHALELAPNDSVIYDNFALTLLMPLGRIQEAVQLLRKAEKKASCTASEAWSRSGTIRATSANR